MEMALVASHPGPDLDWQTAPGPATGQNYHGFGGLGTPWPGAVRPGLRGGVISSSTSKHGAVHHEGSLACLPDYVGNQGGWVYATLKQGSPQPAGKSSLGLHRGCHLRNANHTAAVTGGPEAHGMASAHLLLI